MFLEQYNSILSSMLKQKQSLTRLRKEKRKAIPRNKFEVLSSWVMQCRVEERVVHMVRPQNAQQEIRLVHSLQRKVQEHSSTWSMPLKDIALEQRGWETKKEIVTFVECRGCEYKSTKTEENQEQGFISGKQLRNLQCRNCLEAWKQRKDKGGCKVECVKCGRNNTIRGRKIEERKICTLNVEQGKRSHGGTREQWRGVMPQVNFPWKIIFDMLYTNGFLIRIRSRTLSIFSECNTI